MTVSPTGAESAAADEFAIIQRYFSAFGRGDHVDLGVGDDCAILRIAPGERLAVSVDTLVEGTHFPAGAFPEDIGYRAVSVAVSDLAAMGARPLAVTLSLTLQEADEIWLLTFSEGVAQAVREYAAPLIGGDTTRGPLAVAVQVFGALPIGEALLRSGARPGDAVFVSGPLGDAAALLAASRGEWRPPDEELAYLDRRFYRPRARVELGQQLLGHASAAIDISDGLVADAGHIAGASGVSIHLDPDSVPLSAALNSHPDRGVALQWALAGGDDYELCFTLPDGQAVPPGCFRVGDVRPGQGVFYGDADAGSGGYRHF